MSAAAIARVAIAHERAGRWSEARAAWASIPREPEAAASPRARSVGLAPGQILRHVRRGRVLATCTYDVDDQGRDRFTYDGRAFASASAAARAAAAKLGYALVGRPRAAADDVSGEVLVAWRNELGLSRGAAAELIGVGEMTLRRVEGVGQESYNGWIFWGIEKRADARCIGLTRT